MSDKQDILDSLASIEAAAMQDCSTKEELEDALNVIRAHLIELRNQVRRLPEG